MGLRYLSHTRKVAALNLYLNVRLSFWSINVKMSLHFYLRHNFVCGSHERIQKNLSAVRYSSL